MRMKIVLILFTLLTLAFSAPTEDRGVGYIINKLLESIEKVDQDNDILQDMVDFYDSEPIKFYSAPIARQCSAAISINCGEGTVAVPQGNRTLAMKIVTAINCTEIFEGCECATNSTLPACNSQDNGFVVRVQFGDGTQYFQQYEQPPQFELVYTYQNTGTYSVCIKIRHVKTQGGVRVCLTVNVV